METEECDLLVIGATIKIITMSLLFIQRARELWNSVTEDARGFCASMGRLDKFMKRKSVEKYCNYRSHSYHSTLLSTELRM